MRRRLPCQHQRHEIRCPELRLTLTSLLCALAFGALCPVSGFADEPLPIRTFFVTRSLTHEKLLPYLETARPQIVQIGNYGAMFHGYADHEKSVGWPMQLPVVGERAALEYQRKLNEQVHRLGLKVVGHFRVIKVVGNWKEQTGFIEYYNDRWPRDLLGDRPHPKLIELLQRDGSGEPLQLGRSGQDQLALCLSSPYARDLLKKMLKVAIDNGVDGVMTTYNYRMDCACPHCQAEFKTWLKQELTPAAIEEQLEISNLDDYHFDMIPARIPGYPDVETATPLDWLAARWGAIHFKRMYDEIFVDYGRSLNPNLMIAQWNHLGHVGLGEERALLPAEMWGQNEDYFWYSGGASFVGKNLSLADRKAGDAWLSLLYLRELAQGKPFVMGKYEPVRMAATMAEGYATGGMGMGRYMKFEDPVGFDVLARYTRFMHDHRPLYDGTERFADVALILPRQSVLGKHPESLTTFRDVGQALVERQVLLDVVVDERLTLDRLKSYPVAILPNVAMLSDEQVTALRDYQASGGKLIAIGKPGVRDLENTPREEAQIGKIDTVTWEAPNDDASALVARLRENGTSAIESPWTVRVAGYTQPERVLLHLVNYNRDDSPVPRAQSGPASERPIAAENIRIRLRLPAGRTVEKVLVHRPDSKEPLELRFEIQAAKTSPNLTTSEGVLVCEIPQLLVYCVVEVKTK